MSQEDNSSPLYLASLASKMSPLSPDRPLSRSTPSLAKELKVIVIGSAGVGKTSLVKREAYGEFDEEPQLSVGTERHITKVDIRDHQIDLALYDTVGQERFRTISSTLYRNAQAVLICFDCTSRASFEAVDRWYLDVERNAPQDALILLIVTKIDLKRVVKPDECRQKAAKMGIHLFETSAMTGHNVRALFALIASALIGEQRLRAQSSLVVPPSSPMLSSINLDRLTSKRTDGSGDRSWSFSSAKPGVIRLTDPPGDDRLSTTDSKGTTTEPSSHSCWSSFNPFPGPTSTVTRGTSQSSNASSPRLHPSSSAAMLPIPIPEEGFSLAEVLIEHANQRARTLAGGLRRRNTIDQQDLTLGARKDAFGALETFAEHSSDSQSSGKISLAERGEAIAQKLNEESKPQLRLCTLGCGALLDDARTNHENDECWLRLCPCSLGCGQKFKMLDCVAHEREACKLRTVRCKCGQKTKAEVITDHCASYNGKSISLWSEMDVVHFLLSVFPKEQQRRMINFSRITQGKVDGRTLIDVRTEGKLDEIILSDELINMLETSLSNYSFISSTTTTSSNTTATSTPIVESEYSPWIERPDEEASMLESKHSPSDTLRINNPGAKMLFGFNVVSAQRRFHMLAPSTMLKRVKSRDDFNSPKIGLTPPNHANNKVTGSPSKLYEVDDSYSVEGVIGVARLSSLDCNQHDFAKLWDNWHDQARSWVDEDDLTNRDGVKREIEEETTREVLVPLSLGSKTVAVKTLRFTDLKLNSQDLVGSGSFGSVYLGRYRGAQVAVKHLHYQEVPERDLLREAAVMTSVSGHPHVLRFLGVCLERPNICFVSEALQCSLEEWLRHDRGNHVEPLSEILRYAEEAASGLYHLHLEMVVHRDIAARNLLLDSGNPRRVKVCDFGLARVLPRRNVQSVTGSFGSPSVSHTEPYTLSHVAMLPPPGSVGGSLNLSGPLRWMSPESLRPGSDGLTRFSFASDVYSLAITIWELLSRDVPYAHLQPHEAAIAVMMEDLRPPRAKMTRKVQQNLSVLLGQAENAKCVAQLVALLERAWDKDPVKRPTMRAVVNELSQLRAACGDSPSSPLVNT